MTPERWLNDSTPDYDSSNPAHPHQTANSSSSKVRYYLGWHSALCWLLKGADVNKIHKIHPYNIYRNIAF